MRSSSSLPRLFSSSPVCRSAAPWLQFVLTLAVAKGFAALGVAVLLRAGLISIGHAMFFAASAYGVAFLARAGVGDFATLLVLSVLAAALTGAIAGAFLVRYRAIFFAMLNLAVSMVFYALFAKLYDITGGIGRDARSPSQASSVSRSASPPSRTFCSISA